MVRRATIHICGPVFGERRQGASPVALSSFEWASPVLCALESVCFGRMGISCVGSTGNTGAAWYLQSPSVSRHLLRCALWVEWEQGASPAALLCGHLPHSCLWAGAARRISGCPFTSCGHLPCCIGFGARRAGTEGPQSRFCKRNDGSSQAHGE